MNVIYLSPYFPPNYYLFCVHMRRHGVNVLGIGDVAYDQLRSELRESLTEYYRVENMQEYDNLLRACGYFVHIYGKLDRIESHNEYWLDTEARLRVDFNVHGLKPHQIARFNRRSEIRKLFRNADIPVARGGGLKSMDFARNLIRQTGYPVMFKPNRTVTPFRTYCIHNDAELQDFFDHMPPVRYVAEEFIRGSICSFDGLTDRDGHIVFCTAHIFSQGMMDVVNEDQDMFYFSLRNIPPDLEALGRRAVSAFDIREKFFHIGFFRLQDGGLMGLEIKLGPPGGLTTDMFNYANNIDVYREWANILVNNSFSSVYSRAYHCGYVGRKLSRNYIHSHRDIMQKYGHFIVFHTPIASVFSAAIGNYAYIVNCRTVEEILSVAAFIQETA